MRETLRKFALANWTPSEKALLLTDVLLAGILIGWLTSPLKNGLRLFSGNTFGSHNTGNKTVPEKTDTEKKKSQEEE